MRDRRNKQQKRRDARRDPITNKTEYEKVMSGEIEPKGPQKGWANLRPIPINTRSPEEQQTIRKKGAAAVNKLHGEEKTAKQSLDRMLNLIATDDLLMNTDINQSMIDKIKRDNPAMTVYDVINAAAIGRALNGNIKAVEYIRDTRGDAPIKQLEINENITTDQDRELLKQLNERLKAAEITVIKDV